MDHLLEFFHSEQDDDILDVKLQMLQAWLVVSHHSKYYTVSTVLFHKYGGTNISVTNCMSHFSMFVPTKANVKFDNWNMVHAQVIGIIFCQFPVFPIIYMVVKVHYCPGHPSNTISLVSLEFYSGFQKFTSEPLEHCDFVDPQGRSWRSPYKTLNNLDYLQINIFKVKLQRNRNIVVPTVSMPYQKIISLELFINALVVSLFPG